MGPKGLLRSIGLKGLLGSSSFFLMWCLLLMAFAVHPVTLRLLKFAPCLRGKRAMSHVSLGLEGEGPWFSKFGRGFRGELQLSYTCGQGLTSRGSLKPHTRKPDMYPSTNSPGALNLSRPKFPSPGCSKASWIFPHCLIQHKIVGQLGVVINVHDVPLLLEVIIRITPLWGPITPMKIKSLLTKSHDPLSI